MKPIIATTYAVWPKKNLRNHIVHIIGSHTKADAIQRQFKKIARTYCGLFGCRVYTKTTAKYGLHGRLETQGTTLYDTDRGDWIPYEVRRVKNSKDTILLVGRLKTEAGRKALEERLKNEPR